MDNKITIGDKLDLEQIENRLSVNPNKVLKVYASQVLDESENGDLLVSMPVQEGKLIPLNVGQEFFATFYTKSGLLRCQVVVTGRYKKGSLFLLEIEQLTALQKVQRREYFRLNCHMPVRYRIISDYEQKLINEGMAYNADELELEWKDGTMLDLSGGGIRFVSDSRLTKNAFVQVRFDISIGEEVEVVYAFATLLRTEPNPNNAAVYDNRIMFWKMDSGMQERIIRFIFEAQRKKRSKEAGMD